MIGAGWNGARASPRLPARLSCEPNSSVLAYFAEIPVTIINVQRGGPSNGMPTRTQQSDLIACAYASTATPNMCCVPADPHECFEHSAAAWTWRTGCRRPSS